MNDLLLIPRRKSRPTHGTGTALSNVANVAGIGVAYAWDHLTGPGELDDATPAEMLRAPKGNKWLLFLCCCASLAFICFLAWGRN